MIAEGTPLGIDKRKLFMFYFNAIIFSICKCNHFCENIVVFSKKSQTPHVFSLYDSFFRCFLIILCPSIA